MPVRPKNSSRTTICAALTLLAASLAACAGEYPQSTFDPASDFAAELKGLFNHIFWLTMVVLVLVEVVLLYILVRFRRRAGQPEPKPIHGNILYEMLWTLGPAIIVAFIAVPTIQLIFRTYAPPPEDALIVEAIGHQWWWEFRYPQLEIVTANELHLPVGRAVHVRLSSVDVLHNFWVPRLGGKRYNYPRTALAEGEEEKQNYITFTVNQPGTYSGQCAEFCGASHALMRMRVVAQSPAEFDAWVQEMRTPVAPAAGTLEARGLEVFSTSMCIACHTVRGTNAVGTLGPNLTRIGQRWAIGAGLLENTPTNLERWIRNPVALKPQVKMPAVPLSDEDRAAIVAYLSGLK